MSLLLAASGDIASGVVAPEGVDFDGVTDYLSRSSDLVGNVNSKTFTFSCWVYNAGPSSQQDIINFGPSSKISIQFNANNFRMFARNSAGTIIFQVTSSNLNIPQNTYVHIMLSVDLTNVSNRFLYVNDVLQVPTWNNYSNDFMAFAYSLVRIAGNPDGTVTLKGRLSNLFLDYTYRDLSIEANRRLFITAEGKPADGLDYVDKFLDNKMTTTNANIPRDIRFSSDGTKVLIVNQNSTYGIIQYTLSEAFNLSSATYSTQLDTSSFGTSPYSYDFSLDGFKGLYLDRTTPTLKSFLNSTAFVATTTTTGTFNLSATEANPTCCRWGDDGYSFYIASGTDVRSIKKYTLTIAYDVDSASYTSVVLDTIATSGIRNDSFDYYDSGNKLLVISNDNKKIAVYNLSPAYDISTAVFSHLIDVPVIAYSGGSVQGIASRYTNMYVYSIDFNNDKAYGLYTFDSGSDLNITYGKPANTPAAPILYLPMKDAATAHINEGTGGNFTLNGTIATSNRGANQDNCVASYFDGTADYLSRTSLTGVADGKVFTFSCNYHPYITASGLEPLISFNAADLSVRFRIAYNVSGQTLNIVSANSNTTYNLGLSVSGFIKLGIDTHISISVDLSNSQNCSLLINGLLVTPTFSLYDNSNIVFTQSSMFNIARDNTSYTKGDIGELYFDTKYIDLATSNPFWDKDTNRPKPVRQVIRETGVTPLIAMPLDASNPGKNYGIGGNFTANSAPYVGARGGSEFWARSVKSNLIAGSNLSNTSNLGGVADGKTFSAVVIAKHNDWTYPLVTFNGATENICLAMSTVGAVYSKEAATSNYNLIMSMSGFVNGAWNIGFISVDLTDTNKTFTYLNGTTTTAKNTFVNSNIGFSETTVSYVGKSSTDAIQGENAYVYFTTDYIDFSQEANRLKFIDGLGYPKDLKAQIDAGVIPKPLIYLPFSDPINLGKNLGTGGDFSVVGSVVPSSDVLG